MQGAARRVALERLEIERLRDDALAGERRVPVDEHRQGDGRVVDARASRAVGLLGPGPALDDRVGRLEVARVGDDRDVDLAGRRHARAGRRQVVLDVAGAAFRVDEERVERALALELAQDRLVRAPDGVHEGVQPAPVRHPDHDLVRPAGSRERDRLVEHRHERVEALERELLLAQERAAQVLLEALRLGEAVQERVPLLGIERLPEAARLDRLAQPDALGMVGDVLDLVRDRAGVDGLQLRQRVGQRLPLDVETEDGGGDARLQLGRQRGDEPRLVECRVAHRLGAERIEPRRKMAVHAVGLDERHRRRDAAEERLVDLRAAGRGRLRHGLVAGGGAVRDGLGHRRDGRRPQAPAPAVVPAAPAARDPRPRRRSLAPRGEGRRARAATRRTRRDRPRTAGATRRARWPARRGRPRTSGPRSRALRPLSSALVIRLPRVASWGRERP